MRLLVRLMLVLVFVGCAQRDEAMPKNASTSVQTGKMAPMSGVPARKPGAFKRDNIAQKPEDSPEVVEVAEEREPMAGPEVRRKTKPTKRYGVRDRTKKRAKNQAGLTIGLGGDVQDDTSGVDAERVEKKREARAAQHQRHRRIAAVMRDPFVRKDTAMRDPFVRKDTAMRDALHAHPAPVEDAKTIALGPEPMAAPAPEPAREQAREQGKDQAEGEARFWDGDKRGEATRGGEKLNLQSELALTATQEAGQYAVRVDRVPPGAYAYRMGLRSADVILTVNGATAGLDYTRRALRGPAPPVMEVLRSGKRLVLYPGQSAEVVQRKPARFMPHMCYFENTYLGRSPEYLESLRQLDAQLEPRRFARPYTQAGLPPQPLDAPEDAGMALTATLDRPSLDQPGRVMLQVALQGSRRFGWRRPPLDFALVVDADIAGNQPETLTRAVTGLLRRLGPQDRLGVVVVDPAGPRLLTEVVDLRSARTRLTRALVKFDASAHSDPGDVSAALMAAGGALQRAAEGSARVPGSQAIVLLTGHHDAARVQAAQGAAHQLTVQGATTSVIALGEGSGDWWRVANAGHGNDHRGLKLEAALDAELASLAKVIARLLRVNIKLAPGVEAIRVLGSRVLEQEEVKRVKAREEATDRNLSETLGVKADRGDDDDGIQTVIPYFFGGDTHVILLELWVEHPGAVAEVTLKYKDMVKLSNATARASTSLRRLPRPLTAAHRGVRQNVRGFQLAERLVQVARQLEGGRSAQAMQVLKTAAGVSVADQAMLRGFGELFGQASVAQTARALRLASRRRISHGASPANGAL